MLNNQVKQNLVEINNKQKTILLLEKNFILNKDYKNLLYLEVKQKNIEISNNNFATASAVAKTKGSGGHNIQKFYLNVKNFKSLCLKAQTKKQMKSMNIILN